MEKAVLSIRVSQSFYNKLKSTVPRGQIGAFIEKTVDKKLVKKETTLADEYRECYANPRMLKEAKLWEKASIESWLNYEKTKNKKAK